MDIKNKDRPYFVRDKTDDSQVQSYKMAELKEKKKIRGLFSFA